MKPITIRPAAPADVEAIMRIHHDAIHVTAAPFYSQEILDAWHPPGPVGREPRWILESWAAGEEMIVATIGNAVAGFSSIVARNSELRSVYVDPAYGRKGVGTLLLQEAERIARTCGLTFLHLAASLNAEAFYIERGYSISERGIHRLRSGMKMPCVTMRKDF